MGITGPKPPASYQGDGYQTVTALSRDLVLGDAMVFEPSQPDRVRLSTDPFEVFAGIVGEPYGGVSSGTDVLQGPDAHPFLHKWGTNLRCRIEDNVGIGYLDPLALSSVTAGALGPAGSNPVVGFCKDAVTSGVGQFTACDILPSGTGSSGGGVTNQYAAPDISVGALSLGSHPVTVQIADGAGASISDTFDMEMDLVNDDGSVVIGTDYAFGGGAQGTLIIGSFGSRTLYRTNASGFTDFVVTSLMGGLPIPVWLIVNVMGTNNGTRYVGQSNFDELPFA